MSTTKIRTLVASLAMSTLFVAAASCVEAAETWRAYTYNAVATVTPVKEMQAMFSEIKTVTGGQLDVRLHVGGTLPITESNITQAVSDNMVQIGDDAGFVGNLPVGGLVRLPLLLNTREAFTKAWNIEEPYLQAELKRKGIVLLGKYIYPQNVIWSKRKLTSLSDVQGQKIRVISPEQAEFVKSLGGVPVTLGPSEVAPALDRGVIDGVLTASSGYGYVWRDLLKYSYRINVSFIDSLIIVNEGAWKTLSPEMQAKVKQAVQKYTDRITTRLLAEDEDLTKKLRDGGMVITRPSDADIAQARQNFSPYWSQWGARRPELGEALRKVRSSLGD
ncbi:TRAP transporter substrate-binding protein DctP [Chitinasiproducens palmae]|uniref:TRAP-type C4-dicarboxylate transport system, substrate-binding protein n=1 Tax=Chitinasiproducens palmae TaxID=1770053 RepID=A0A1H2PMD5_9BURK|nr:TRAP transporter substrate-binding protein DctP [Chitinasiproducens palmae]SDV47227.1 TRAP-type C4-dicarboxylate transport system, substrate-binding protein [Chitinasiproducens palmae]